ncbi:hypothetical protein [Deinococcus marmoris]|uniref:Dihydrofolate reductase n=1 Tax=Deinococcus marmoris TaxID=249408 RepID=A0A1U7NTC8_9DEIO|nr:hypothetical protein [Deinococcus marmoris]OLV16178.1 Dihydrofolate reductase [Deinococcus marmoris]
MFDRDWAARGDPLRKVIVTEFLTLDGVYEDSTPWQQGYTSHRK